MPASQTPSKTKSTALGSSKLRVKKSDNPKNFEEDTDKSPIEKLDALHDAFKRRRTAHRKAVYSDIVAAVDIGLALKADKNEWKRFCEGSWHKTKPPRLNQIDQAVRFAIKFMVGPGKNAQQKASFYYSAVASAVEGGITGKKLKKLIMAKSLKKLTQAKSDTKNPEKQKAQTEKKNDSKTPRTAAMTKETKKSDPLPARKTNDASDQEKMKDSEFNVKAVLRFGNTKKSLTTHKVGSKVWMKVTLTALGPPHALIVHKLEAAKPKAKESVPDV